MICSKGTTMKLCPVSLGLAAGLTCGLGMFIWAVWLMYYGMTPMMAEYRIPVLTFQGAAVMALIGLLKGFVFGFFIALFYDFIVSRCSCYMKNRCCCKKEACSSCAPASEDKSGLGTGTGL